MLSAKHSTTSLPGLNLDGYATHDSNVQLPGPGGSSRESSCIGAPGWAIVAAQAWWSGNSQHARHCGLNIRRLLARNRSGGHKHVRVPRCSARHAELSGSSSHQSSLALGLVASGGLAASNEGVRCARRRSHPSLILTLRLDVSKRTPRWRGRAAHVSCVDFAVPSSALRSPLIGSAATHTATQHEQHQHRPTPTPILMSRCCHDALRELPRIDVNVSEARRTEVCFQVSAGRRHLAYART